MLYRSVGEEFCRELLEKSVTEMCSGKSVGEESYRDVWLKRGGEKCCRDLW